MLSNLKDSFLKLYSFKFLEKCNDLTPVDVNGLLKISKESGNCKLSNLLNEENEFACKDFNPSFNVTFVIYSYLKKHNY